MSFDEGGDPPTQRAPRPRRSTTAPRTSGPDDQTLLVRRAVAAVGAVVVLIVIVLLVRSFLNSRRDAALRSYNSTITQIASDARDKVSTPLFTLLTNPTKASPQDTVVPTVQTYRVEAQAEASRAAGLKVPDAMIAAQRDLLLALDLRAEAVKRIADAVPNALGGQSADQGVKAIAAQMEVLLSSDVIYAQRVNPLVTQALADHNINQPVVASEFLPDLAWLGTQFVTARLTGNSGGLTAAGKPKPGSHGHGLLAVSVGGTTLTEGTNVNTVKATPGLTFDLKVANQGSNDETGVVVKLAIDGTATPITPATKTIDTKAGTVVDVMIPVPVTPPPGNVRLVATVAKVPGEVDVTNNKKTFLANFTR